MRNKIILVYPLLGMAGTFVKHAPLGLLYAASQVVKSGYEVVILDARLYPDSWKEKLTAAIDDNTLMVGISVMTGKPIEGALEIGKLVKSVQPDVNIVWGGPFATFHPEYILRDAPECDYAVSGYGAAPLAALADSLAQGKVPRDIPGIFYRDGDSIGCTPADWSSHECIHFRDIPYELIDDYGVYGQLDQDKVIFSMYSAMGCAYNCAFCSSPALYKHIKGKRWQPFAVDEVVDHIEYVVEKYGATYIYFIDDDSFVNLKHVEDIIDEIDRRGVKVKLGFRGARINEIKLMSHEFIDKLVRAGTDILHIGAESGSDRILDLVRKNCTVEDILECNRKLAKHPEIQLFYNFIFGLPTETVDDLKATSTLMLELIKDNPSAIIGIPNLFRPLPGTELFERAKTEWSYQPPSHLLDFVEIEVEGDFDKPWFSAEYQAQCSMMRIASYFIDNKILKVTSGKTWFYRILRLLSSIYAPIARYRLRNGVAGWLVEDYAFRIASNVLAGK